MLQLQNISKSYGRKAIIRTTSFQFEHGVYGLLGPNGAGKTTLIHMMAALSRPSSGHVLYKGRDVLENNLVYYRELGFLPQKDAIYPNMKAKDYLFYLAALKGIGHVEAKKRILDLAELCNLSGELEKRCGKYSGGMKRRLGLMQAMLNNPRVLILDEPTSGLDPIERIRLRNLISDLSLDRTVIFSTHIVPDVEQIAKHIVFLREGQFVAGSFHSFANKMQGKVWEIKLDEKDLPRFQQEFILVSIRSTEHGNLIIRFLSEQPPHGACPMKPSLEDTFVSMFPMHTVGVEVEGERQ